MKKCQYKQQVSFMIGVNLFTFISECSLPTFENHNYCVCHLDVPDKPIDPILKHLKNRRSTLTEHNNLEIIDGTGYIFPKADFTYPNALRTPLFFNSAKFYGNANFQNVQFTSYTSFHSTQFLEDVDFGAQNIYANQTTFNDTVDFSSAIFHKSVNFRACIFKKNPMFFGTEFRGHTNFTFCSFNYNHPNPILFNLAKFTGKTSFDVNIKGNIPGVKFDACDLSELRFSTLPIDKIEFNFNNISWNKSRKPLEFSRNKISDENEKSTDPILLSKSYKFLETYFYNNANFALSSHFYVGMMKSFRRNSDYNRISRLINYLYYSFSNYGESIIRPSLALLITLLVFPIVLLFSGIHILSNDNSITYNESNLRYVNYNIQNLSQVDDLHSFLSDYYDVFCINLSLSTIDRNNKISPFPNTFSKILLIFETALIVIFLSLLIISVRRKFTPKKPTGL